MPKDDYQDLIDELLCGDVPTMSMLLDLIPVKYWTNASAIPEFEDHAYSKHLVQIVRTDSLSVK